MNTKEDYYSFGYYSFECFSGEQKIKLWYSDTSYTGITHERICLYQENNPYKRAYNLVTKDESNKLYEALNE